MRWETTHVPESMPARASTARGRQALPWHSVGPRAAALLMLPVAAAFLMLVAFEHVGSTRAAHVESLGRVRHLAEHAIALRWQTECAIDGTPAQRSVLDEHAGEFERLLASTAGMPEGGHGDNADELAEWKRARARLEREWKGLHGTILAARMASAESPERADLILRAGLKAERLEEAAVELARSTQRFEREEGEAGLARLGIVASLLLLAFGGVSVVLFIRTAQVRERERQVRQLASVAEHAGSGVIVAGPDGRARWSNPAAHRITGWSSLDADGHPVADLLIGPGDAPARSEVERAFREQLSFRGELRIHTRAGAELWADLEITPVSQDDGGDRQFVVTFQDVTARRQAGEALSASEARYRSALDAMAEGLVIMGPTGLIESCNTAAERILGLSADHLSGRLPADPRFRALREDGSAFPPEDLPAMVTLRTGRPVSGVLMGVTRPDGTQVWISIEANAIWRPGCADPVGVVTTFLDVTARRRSDVEIRKLMQAVEQSPSACLITDADRNIEYVNRCFEATTGWPKDELVGRNPNVLAGASAPSGGDEAMWEALGRGERWQGELAHHRRSGEAYRVRVTAFPLLDSDGRVTHYVSFSDDITAEHCRALELASAREEALAAARAKTEFLQRVSHELRTPMNGILGMTALLQQTGLSGTQRSDLDTLRDSAEQLLAVINQLFHFTQPDSNESGESCVGFRLRNSLLSVAGRLASGAEARSLGWKFDVDPDVPDHLRGDPGGLRQVLLHLIDNALKFTDHGEVAVHVSAPEGTGSELAQLRFEVRDTGVGIAPGSEAAIFEAFEQADGSSTRKYGGMGLGLTLARRIVHRLGGRLALESVAGNGSTFAFSLPFEVVKDEPQAAPGPLSASVPEATILLVDGGGASRTLACEALSRPGLVVQVVPGAEAVIALVRESLGRATAPRVIVLDERGGGLDPFAAARRMREALGESLPPVALVSVAGRRGDAERCRELGVHAYLTEPLGDNDLFESVRRLLLRDARPARDGELVTRHFLRESRRSVRVLLVEDNAVNRKVATRLLERSGFTVGIAEDGRAGAEKFREGGWDAVLMDIQMPVMDGIQAAMEIRRWEGEHGLARTPIIAVTAHTLDADREAALEAGMDAFVAKPILADLLLRAIQECLGDSPGVPDEDFVPPELREVLDWDEALERMDGDETVLKEILRLFLQDSENMMLRLEQARASGDAKLIERAAHGLKGASATISARSVAPLAREVESLAREGQLVRALDLMPELRVEMQRLRRSLEAIPDAERRAA